jgi:histidine triad (HIT) family protein
MLPKNQIPEIKKQLLEQISQTFPPEAQENAIQQIQAMNDEQLEEFLIQNKLIKNPETLTNQPIQKNPQMPQCIMCAILKNQIQSYKIDENKQAIAILEINPISIGHSIIIPKGHITESNKIPAQTFSLAKKIAGKIKTKLKPKDIQIFNSEVMQHQVVNVLPIYGNEQPTSQRQKAEEKDLQNLQKKLEVKKRKTPAKKSTKKSKQEPKIILPKRIP